MKSVDCNETDFVPVMIASRRRFFVESLLNEIQILSMEFVVGALKKVPTRFDCGGSTMM